MCLQCPITTFYLFISILILKLHLFLSLPRGTFPRQFRRNKSVQISFLQHESQFFIFTMFGHILWNQETFNLRDTVYFLNTRRIQSSCCLRKYSKISNLEYLSDFCRTVNVYVKLSWVWRLCFYWYSPPTSAPDYSTERHWQHAETDEWKTNKQIAWFLTAPRKN